MAAGAVMPVPAQSQAESAEPAVARIRAFYDALVATMKQAQQLGVRGRYDKLAPAVRATFDLAAMTRIAVGSQWNSIPADQQTALVDAFSRMTIATYANRFDGYSGERFDVQPASEARATGRVVRTKLIQSNGVPVVLDYLMRGSGDDWKIVDVYLEGTISELATRRLEFAAILKTGGPAVLVKSLADQATQMLGARASNS
jgi:phospholipid transport system substrate-binding protein